MLDWLISYFVDAPIGQWLGKFFGLKVILVFVVAMTVFSVGALVLL